MSIRDFLRNVNSGLKMAGHDGTGAGAWLLLHSAARPDPFGTAYPKVTLHRKGACLVIPAQGQKSQQTLLSRTQRIERDNTSCISEEILDAVVPWERRTAPRLRSRKGPPRQLPFPRTPHWRHATLDEHQTKLNSLATLSPSSPSALATPLSLIRFSSVQNKLRVSTCNSRGQQLRLRTRTQTVRRGAADLCKFACDPPKQLHKSSPFNCSPHSQPPTLSSYDTCADALDGALLLDG